MKKTCVVGITGGIGSGKSYVLQLLAQRGFPTYQADRQAQKIMENHPDVRKALIQWLGDEIFLPEGKLNRPLLAQYIFQNPTLKRQVEMLVHPLTVADFRQWVTQQNASFVFKEAALTLEADATEGLDKLIVVYAPIRLRIQRLKDRDPYTDIAILQRMAAQWPDLEKLRYADFVVYNFPSAPPLSTQIDNFFAFCVP